MDFFGYLILIIFIIFLLQMIKEGPFIFQTGKRYFIDIKDIQFNINKLYIKKGDTLEIINYDQFRHSIVTKDNIIPNSGLLYQYDRYSHTFNRNGTFIFSSSLYNKMEDLIIIVEEPIKGNNYYNEIKSNLRNTIIKISSNIFNYVSSLFFN